MDQLAEARWLGSKNHQHHLWVWLGSPATLTSFPYYYSAAKSALHQLMRTLAEDVAGQMGNAVSLY